MKAAQNILLDFDLRKTSSRAAVLDLFMKKKFALSYSDVEEQIGQEYDRVTIYRTLKTFVDKGVLHKVLDDGGGLKYALCNELCTSAGHHHEHVHFKCSDCGETSCLEQVNIPTVELPIGYTASEINLLIQGKCQKCG